jgi:ribosomal protein S27E
MKGTITYNCDHCGKEVTKHKSTYNKSKGKHYCNKDCYWAHNRGSNHYKYAASNIQCDYCGEPIEVNQWLMENFKHHFCGRDCHNKHTKEFGPKGENHPIYKKIEVECANCGEKLLRVPSDVERAELLYCNKICMDEHRRRIGYYSEDNNANYRGGEIAVECAICGRVLKRKQCVIRDHDWFVCSPECRGKYIARYMRGENSASWKGGITPINITLRTTAKYIQWRTDVFKRDGYICKICEKGGDDIEAHHIISFTKLVNENNITTTEEAMLCDALWDTTNGVTFCYDCHKDIHAMIRSDIAIEATREYREGGCYGE